MRNTVFTLFSAVSLILFGATVLFWVRSYWVEDVVVWSSGPVRFAPEQYRLTRRGAVNSSGQIAVGRDVRQAYKLETIPRIERGWSHEVRLPTLRDSPLSESASDRLGFGRTEWGFAESYKLSARFTNYRFPHWSVALTLTVAPGWWASRYVRLQRRRRRGACETCGYDLRASPNRCPECGTLARVTPRVRQD